MRCSVHCPSGGSGFVAFVAGLGLAGGALALAVVAAAGTQLVWAISLLCGVLVLVFLFRLRLGPEVWRPERVPNPRVRKALEAAAAVPVEAAAPPAIEAPPVRLPVYAVITDVGVRDR